MKYNIKLAAASLILVFTSVSQASTKLTTKEDFTRDFEIGKSYPVIVEGYEFGRIVGMFCGAIAFTTDSTDKHLFYTFKAWSPEKGKCNFQSSDPAPISVTHHCVSDKYTNNRFLTPEEIEDTLPGNRAIEIESNDDHFYVLSRCHGTTKEPAYIAGLSEKSTSRDPEKNVVVVSMKNESRSFKLLKKTKINVDVMSIQLSNELNYVIIKDPTIN